MGSQRDTSRFLTKPGDERLRKETMSWFGLEGLALLISVEEMKCVCLIHPTDIYIYIYGGLNVFC